MGIPWKRQITVNAPDLLLVESTANAIASFLRKESHLLEVGANERTISQRLSIYLQRRFKEYNVDCEYNRNGYYPKRLGIDIQTVTSDDIHGVSVYPDIVVHKRGQAGPNILVIEIKKNANVEFCRRDLEKLGKIKAEFNYRAGLFINFGTIEYPIIQITWV